MDFAGNRAGPLAATTIVPIDEQQAALLAESRIPVMLGFIGSRADRPVILGVVQGLPLPEAQAQQEPERGEEELAPFEGERLIPERAIVDGHHISLHGREEIELRCGKASITLNKSGRVVIRGTELISYSSGSNRIRGGSVELN